MIKRIKFIIVIFLCAILCVSMVGCCGCFDERQEIEPYEVTYRFKMLDENGTRYDRMDVLKYNVDGQVMTVYYSYGHGIIDIDVSGTSSTETRTTQSSEDSGSILGQDSYFEY